MTTKTAVVLVNLGAPSKMDEIQPFLKNLFSDPDIFHFPFGRIGQAFFSSIISKLRLRKSRSYYNKIGGGSPLRKITEKQGSLLSEKLNSQGEFTLFTAQRYWHPLIQEITQEIETGKFTQVILIPLYPQFSTTTTQSVINEWNRKFKGNVQLKTVSRFYNHPLYLKACIHQIEKALRGYKEPPYILFSAHSIPISRVKNGDTYPHEVEDHVRLIMTQIPENLSYSLCYQSKVGPVKWLEPTVEQAVETIMKSGRKSVLVFPVSFVAENLETLYELDIQKKEIALAKGITSWKRVPALDCSAGFIDTLYDLVLDSA